MNYYFISIGRLLRLIKKHKNRLFTAGGLLFITILLELPMPLLTKYLLDHVLTGNNFNLLLTIIGFLMAFHLVKYVTAYLHAYNILYFRENVLVDVNLQLYDHLQKQPLDFFRIHQSSYLASRIREDVYAIQSFFGNTVLNVSRDVLTFIVGSFAVFFLHWKLALASLVILPFFILSMTLFNTRIREYQRDFQEMSALVYKDIQESFSGIYYIKIFQNEDFQKKIIEHSLMKVQKLSIKSSLLKIKADAIALLISSLGPIIILGYGGYLVMHKSLSLGGLVAFSAFLTYLYGPAQRLVYANNEAQRGFGALDRIYELLAHQVESNGLTEISAIPSQPPHIEFHDVTFSYSDQKPVLKNINLHLEHSKIYALVGHSGVGKTTLVNLIPKFYLPQKGEIQINGMNIARIHVQNVRKMVGIVGQEPFMFNSTIQENIRFGDVNCSQEAIITAAKMANAHDFIMEKPEKYLTVIGEFGAKLSVGEKQRIGIARSLIKNPYILILDEPTSASDPESEQLILNSLQKIKKDRIIIVIAHRPSTILAADDIYVIRNGEILERGFHDELYSKGTFYYELFNNIYKKPQQDVAFASSTPSV